MNVNLLPGPARDWRDFGFFDDFEWYISPHRWTNLAADVGVTAFAESDARCGIITGATGATDNNEIAMRTTKELFAGVAGKPMWAEVYLQYAEANTDDANVAFGFSDQIAANLLVDDGAGPDTDFDGALIYKVDGGTAWKVVSSNGTSQTISATGVTAGGAAYQRLRICITDYTTSKMQVTYFVDDVQLRDSTYNLPIVHTIAIASWTEMEVGCYLKAGGANSETLNIDFLQAYQTR